MTLRRAVFTVVALSSLIAACTGHTSSSPNNSGGYVSPFALQSNAPSPSPWQQEPDIGAPLVVGADGHSMWASGNSGITRLDISTNAVQSFGGSWQAATAGPNGLMWYCDDAGLHTIDDNGSTQSFSETWTACTAIEEGPDGNLWLSAFDPTLRTYEAYKVTPGGQATEYVLPHGAGQALIGDLDGNVWYPTYGSGNNEPGPYVAKINATSGVITEYPLVYKHRFPISFTAIDSGHDGNIYVIDTENDRIVRVSETGTVKTFKLQVPLAGHATTTSVADVFTIYYGFPDPADLLSWTVSGHIFTNYGSEPFGGAVNPLRGPDTNVWTSTGVYLIRILTVTPQSASLKVGGSQQFSIAETNCKACVWSAVSEEPGVASVSAVSGNAFTVTGVSAGTAQIDVSDQRYNVVHVQVTVN